MTMSLTTLVFPEKIELIASHWKQLEKSGSTQRVLIEKRSKKGICDQQPVISGTKKLKLAVRLSSDHRRKSQRLV